MTNSYCTSRPRTLWAMDALLQVAPGTVPSGPRRDIERWFVRRGVPQFIEGYSTEQSMDARAAPFIAAWIVIWTVLYWLGRPDIPLPWDLVGALASLLFVLVAYRVIMAIRRRSVSGPPRRFDVTDIAAFAILPGIPTLVVGRDPAMSIVMTLNILLGIGIIYTGHRVRPARDRALGTRTPAGAPSPHRDAALEDAARAPDPRRFPDVRG